MLLEASNEDCVLFEGVADGNSPEWDFYAQVIPPQ